MPDVMLTPDIVERLKLRDRPRRGIGSPPHTTRGLTPLGYGVVPPSPPEAR